MAKAGDKRLRELARKDCAEVDLERSGPGVASKQVELAESWLEWAREAKDASQADLGTACAEYWYVRAATESIGLKRMAAEQRLKEIRGRRRAPSKVARTDDFRHVPAVIFSAAGWEHGLKPSEDKSDPFRTVQVDNKACLRADRSIGFDVNDQFARYLPGPGSGPVVVCLTAYIEQSGTLYVEYDGPATDPRQGFPRKSALRRVEDAQRWVDLEFELPGAELANRLPGGADLRVVGDDGCSFGLSKIRVVRTDLQKTPFQEAPVARFTAPDQAHGLEAFRGGDGPYATEQVEGRWVLRTERAFLYFRIDDSFAFDLPAGVNERIILR